MADSELLVKDSGATRTITLHRPEKRNPLSRALMVELLGELGRTAKDTAVHTVVLRGAPPAFSAGHDLSEVRGGDLAAMRELFQICAELMLAVHSLPQPVIAAVDGIATAAGCQLVAACDLAIATERATFATPGVRIGLFCSTPMVEVSRSIGRKRALQLLLTGDAIDAQKALDWGLVNQVVPIDELDAAVTKLTEKLGAASSYTLQIGKLAFSEQLDLSLADAYAYTAEVMAQNAVAHDAQEGIDAFLSKRHPTWQGRQ